MSGIAYRSMLTEGDRWLERAVDGLANGDDVVGAGSCAAIAQAYYTRAALEKPDTLASLLAAGAAAKDAQAQPQQAPDKTAVVNGDLDAAVKRHPAGRRIADNPQA